MSEIVLREGDSPPDSSSRGLLRKKRVDNPLTPAKRAMMMVAMRVSILVASGLAVLVGFVIFIAYYFMLWPFQPTLTVDDPIISEWLEQDGVVIYRRGEELINNYMYIIKGERIGDGCSWHMSSTGSDMGVVVGRVVATNHHTCESLVKEGMLVE